MSDPVRLLDDPGAPGSVTELMHAIEPPTPLSEAGRAALAARITASAAVVPVTAAKLLTLKAGVAALVAGGGLALLVTALDAPTPPPVAAPAVAVAPATPTPESKVAPVPAPPVVESAPAEPPHRPVNARPPSPKDTLAMEESLLERARESLGTPSRSLALLAEHERRFPGGELTAERLYLSARAHEKAGNVAQAQKYAQALARRFPKSTYLAGVKSLLDAP